MMSRLEPGAAVTPDAPVALYRGTVMHARCRPVQHSFAYRVMSLLIDLDRLDEADRQSRLFAVNRAAPFSFRERDHGDRTGASLNSHVRGLAAERGIDLAGGRILLLCYPRVFGYVFNPLSIYFCHDAVGRLVLLIYEVRNTFGEMHSYLLPVQDAVQGPSIRHSQTKEFYVSPFMEMRTTYDFKTFPPAEQVKIRIAQNDATGTIFTAAFSGRRIPLTDNSLLAALVALPLLTFKVMAAIHWQALRLWLKGVPLVPRLHQRKI